MKTNELLNEWKSFLEKELLNEISIKKFQEQYPDFDIISFSPQLKGNTDYLDIIKNSIEAGEQHSPDDYKQQFDFYKNSIEPNRKNKDFLTVNIPGGDPVSLEGKLNQGRCTATYNDIQQFQQARLETGKGSKNKLANAYIKALEEANELNFELVAENNKWIIFYPKSIVGSIALARSYWDGNKIAYDNTFQASKGFGQNTGTIKWCTSVSGGGNMFLNYHRRLNLHMYYCIKKNLRDINAADRKLCISLSKSNEIVRFQQSSASVDGNNNPIDEKQAKKYIGSLYDVLIEDAKQDIRLEIDAESYYKSISLEQYLTMRAANEENIPDFKDEVVSILQYSKDADKIAIYVAKDSSSDIRPIAASNKNLPPETLKFLAQDKNNTTRIAIAEREDLLEIDPSGKMIRQLANDKDRSVRCTVAYNSNIPPTILSDLAEDEDPGVKSIVAGNINTPPDTLRFLAKVEDRFVKSSVASNSNTPPDTLGFLAKDEDSYEYVRVNVARNSNTPPKVLSILAYDKEHNVRRAAADNKNTPPGALLDLAEDTVKYVRASVAEREDLLELDPSGEIIKKLANDKDPFVRSNVAFREDLLEFDPSGEIIKKLANDEIRDVRETFRYRPEYVEFLNQATNESVLEQYIKTLLN